MKKLVTSLFFIILFLSGMSQHVLKLELSTGDCRKKEPVRIGADDTINFYKNGVLNRQIITMNYNRWPIEIFNFESGIYTIQYKNIFDKIAFKEVNIPDTVESFYIKLCPDELLESDLNSDFKLENNDTIEIQFSTSGCFHRYSESIKIYKQQDVFVSELKDRDTSLAVKMNQKMLSDFVRFKNEIIVIKDSKGCTTTDKYIIKSKNWNLTRIDGGCEWDGYYFLKKSLFNYEE